MATAKTIQCEDCGRKYETTRKNTKYCRVCRVFRDLAYLRALTKTCVACDRDFAPMRRDDLLCGHCDPTTSKQEVEGDCALCQVHANLLHADIAVCKGCATDPEKRELFMKALAKKRRASQEGAI